MVNQGKNKKNISDSYNSFEDNIFKIFKWFSTYIDRFIFENRYSFIVALGIAIVLYFSINFNSEDGIFTKSLNSSKNLNQISVTERYNNETFEISNVPEYCDLTFSGDAVNVNSATSKKGYCLVDLEGYTEGTHNVKLQAIGYGEGVDIKINPSNAIVTLKKKTTSQFPISYDFINADKLEDKYILSNPIFEKNKVNIRASQDVLDSIAFVKALIDVNGISGDFSKEAVLVAYNKKGEPVNADIVPNKVNVSVSVSSPNKTVPVVMNITGELPNNLAIDSVYMDHQTVTIYAPESELANINYVTVNIDASTLSKDTKMTQPISLPNNVTSSDITKLNLEIKVAEKKEKIVEAVPITLENYDNTYNVKVLDNQTTVSVKVYGSESNISQINKEDLTVFLDLKNVGVGTSDIELQINKTSNPYVKLELLQKTLNITLEMVTEGES